MAQKRDKLVSEVEYNYKLCLRKGNYYAGSATVNLFLKDLPAKGDLFLNHRAVAISSLKVNSSELSYKD